MITLIVQARTGSTRLPGKILMQIEGKPMLQLELEHVKKADAVVLATTDLLADLEI